MKRKIFALLILSSLAVVPACTSDYNLVMKDSEETFYKGQYLEAARKLLPAVNRSGRDQLLFMMEAGLMLHAGLEYKKSTDVLTEAGKLAREMAVSISKGAAALVLNETMTNYRGEEHERVMIHMYLGLNRIMMGDGEAARVDFKKVNDLLREIVETGGRDYKQNVMAKYLTGIAFEVSADAENDSHDREFAYIEYKQIQQLRGRMPLVLFDLQRVAKLMDDDEDFGKWVGMAGRNYQSGLPKNAGEVVVVFQAGKGPIKVSRGPIMSEQAMANGLRVAINGLRGDQAAAAGAIMIALNKAENPIPRFKMRDNRVEYCQVLVNNRNYGRTYMLENIEDTAVKNLDDQYGRMVGKVAAGIVTKAAISIAAGIAAKKLAEQSRQLGAFSGVIGTLVGAGTGAALISQMKPDLRCWHTLPANLQLGKMYLPEGEHLVTINLVDRRGGVVDRLEKTIKVEKDKRNFFNLRTLF
jgi:uncharacterized membrane protein YeaQ/YmgE (transglycosylase-associated protein family)